MIFIFPNYFHISISQSKVHFLANCSLPKVLTPECGLSVCLWRQALRPHLWPDCSRRLPTDYSKVFIKKEVYVFSLFHFFKDSTLSTWSLETQTDPFIHSHWVVSEVSKFDVNFILWQSIFSKVLSLRLSRRDFTSHFIFPAPLFIFYPGGSCREKVGEIYTGSIPAAYYSERQTKIPINRRQPALYLLFIGISD